MLNPTLPLLLLSVDVGDTFLPGTAVTVTVYTDSDCLPTAEPAGMGPCPPGTALLGDGRMSHTVTQRRWMDTITFEATTLRPGEQIHVSVDGTVADTCNTVWGVANGVTVLSGETRITPSYEGTLLGCPEPSFFWRLGARLLR